MTGIYNAQTVSGLAIQQQYRSTALSGFRTSAERTPRTTRLVEDTVDISQQAYKLFRAQNGGTAIETITGNQVTTDRDAAAPKTPSLLGTGSSISNRISDMKAEISSLRAEISALEEKAQTDEIAAELLRTKKARLSTLEAMLTGLIAKSFMPA